MAYQGIESFLSGAITSGEFRVVSIDSVPNGWGTKKFGAVDFAYVPAVGHYRWEYSKASSLVATNWYPITVNNLLVARPPNFPGWVRNFRLVPEPGVTLSVRNETL